jgi:excisionase family DNA binding protein
MERGTVRVDVGIADSIEGKARALLVSEVAALLSISGRQIYKLVAENRIPYLRIGGSIRFDPHLLAAWLRSQFIRQHLPSDENQVAEAEYRNQADGYFD